MNTSSHLSAFRSTLAARWRRVGAGPLLFSVAFHVALIAIAVLILHSTFQEKPVDFLPASSGAKSITAERQLSESVHVNRASRREKAEQLTRIASLSSKTVVHIPDMEFLPREDTDGLLEKMLHADASGSGGMAPGQMSQSWQGSKPGSPAFDGRLLVQRCGGWHDRLAKLHANGGNDQCERAVSSSLQWLKEHQNADGSWGSTHTGAMTGLALLCYLGRCETQDSTFYGDNVWRGILYLVELGAKNEQGILAANPKDHAAAYDHGIATYALGEMYSLARLGGRALPGMREAFEKGVNVILQHQLPDGGWGYGESFCYRDAGAGDLSVTGWQFQALKAAKYSQLKFPGLPSAMDRTVKYLAARQTKDGGFGNANREQGYNQWNLTGTALLGLQTLGHNRHQTELNKGLRFAQTFFTSEPPQWNSNANLYAWYYYDQAFFQSGGEAWSRWNSVLLPELLQNQKSDGSWREETFSSQIGSTAAAGADRAVYRTALCTLMLEVYFRYLRVGDREEGSMFERKGA